MTRLHFTGLLEPSRVDAVEVHQLEDGSQILRHIALHRKGKHLGVFAMHPSLSAVDDLVDLIPENVPVVVVLTGKGVLMRSRVCDPETPDEVLVKSVFPDARIDDFILSRWALGETGSVFCLARLSQVETLARTLLSYKFQIAELHIGPLTIAGILPLMGSLNQPLIAGQCSFNYINGQLTEVQFSQSEPSAKAEVGGLSIPGALLCAFSAAFEFMVINRFQSSTPIVMVREKAREMMTLARTRGAMILAVGLLFILLLANFFIYDHVTHKYSEKASVIGEKILASKMSDSLKACIQQREKFLAQSVGKAKLKCSFIIDRIGSAIPSGITLTEIAVNPFQFKGDDVNKEPAYRPGTIRVRALVRESGALNQWISRLESIDFIESVAFGNYREKDEHVSGVTLDITMK